MKENKIFFGELNKLSELISMLKECNTNKKFLNIKNKILKYESEGSIDNINYILYELTNELRAVLMNSVHSLSDYYFKSPPINVAADDNLRLLGVQYAYERDIQPTIIEDKIASYREEHYCWDSSHVLFSSGMSAISTLFSSLIFSRSTIKKQITLGFWGGYFEIRHFFEIISGEIFKFNHVENQEELVDNTLHNNYDILLIEPTRYNEDLESFNLVSFLSKLIDYRGDLLMVIFDTTLIANELPFYEILDVFKKNKNITFIRYSSCLKLEQQGLELTNCGLISIYSNKSNGKLFITDFTSAIRKIRSIYGVGLRLDEVLILNIPFVFNKGMTKEYTNQIFYNNALVANSIRTGTIFQKIAHPQLINRDITEWSKAPFFILSLKDSDEYDILANIIEYESSIRNINFILGNSFGFRHHRYEPIIPDVKEKKAFFKIAMGYTRTDIDNIILMFNELTLYNTFEELKKNYCFALTTMNNKDDYKKFI